MGLFSFLRGKGKTLGAAQAAEAPPEKDALEKELDDLGLDRSGVEIEVEPHRHRVRIKGHPKDQETREKVILAVGNVAGVAEVEDEATGPEPRFHTVEAGESLWKIAEATLGDGSRYTEIFEANKPMLTDPDKIYPGQVLRIPAA
jgi:nucleoid-associated protein YgaU